MARIAFKDALRKDRSADPRRLLGESSVPHRDSVRYHRGRTIPTDIKIHDNIAVVHYYYSTLEKDPKGGEKRSNGRKTDVLIKQANKWIIIADHGGNTHKI